MRLRWFVIVLVIAPILVIAVLLGGFIFTQQQQSNGCDPQGPALTVDPATIPEGTVAGLTREQLTIAAQIMVAAQQKSLSARDQRIGVMVGIGESDLRNLNYGDAVGPDSRGVFQQRDNGAWGSLADRMNPPTAAANFFTALARVTDRQNLAPTLVANKVQRNADPNYYAQFWDQAGQITRFLAGVKGSQVQAAPSGEASSETIYDLPKVLPGTKAVANTLGTKFGVKTIGGWRPADAYPDHPGGWALDFMVDRSTGDALAAYAQQNAANLHVEYILWRQRSWSPARADEGWRGMADRGSPTANHMDHVHISVVRSWAAGGAGLGELPPATCASDGEPNSTPNAAGWVAPAKAPLSSGFGPRSSPGGVGSTWHKGLDFGARCGAPIYAAAAGVVTRAGSATGYGHAIYVDHGAGLSTRYGHMYAAGLLVRAGDRVTAGQQIAVVGSDGVSTGCHLHFEVRTNDQAVDPRSYLKQFGVSLG